MWGDHADGADDRQRRYTNLGPCSPFDPVRGQTCMERRGRRRLLAVRLPAERREVLAVGRAPSEARAPRFVAAAGSSPPPPRHAASPMASTVAWCSRLQRARRRVARGDPTGEAARRAAGRRRREHVADAQRRQPPVRAACAAIYARRRADRRRGTSCPHRQDEIRRRGLWDGWIERVVGGQHARPAIRPTAARRPACTTWRRT